jgi:raffinose/stachyose/melibiose transport system substrate-binding protein
LFPVYCASCISEPAKTPAPPSAGAETGQSGKTIVLKIFTNLIDRKNGQGFVEQMLIESYMAENKNVTIEVEALQDEPYKTKFKAYALGSGMPDLVSAWGQPSFLYEIIDAGLLAELDPNDYSDYRFIPGALDAFTKDGKLYGLPRNTDAMGFYYNTKMFADNGWAVPATYSGLLDLAGYIQEKNNIPCVVAGGDKWPLAIFYHDLVCKLEGDFQLGFQKAIDASDYSDPVFIRAGELFQDAYKAGLFQKGFVIADYDTAKNLFAGGKSAMFYTGSWDMSMADPRNRDILPEVRENIDLFMMPEIEGGRGAATDIEAWIGGGYAISSNSPVRGEALKFLNYMFEPENWSKLSWENGICMSAQNYSAYYTGDETPVQKKFSSVVAGATSISGTTFNDRGSSEYKALSENLIQELAICKITPQEFVDSLSGS